MSYFIMLYPERMPKGFFSLGKCECGTMGVVFTPRDNIERVFCDMCWADAEPFYGVEPSLRDLSDEEMEELKRQAEEGL